MKIFFQLNNFLCLGLAGIIALLVLTVFFLTSSILPSLVLLAFMGLGCFRPLWLVYLLAASLPLFGDRPGSLQQFYQLALLAGCVLVLGVRSFYPKQNQPEFYKFSGNPVLATLSLLTLSSVISLLAIPDSELGKFFSDIFPYISWQYLELLPGSIRQILRASEEQVAYSFVASCWTLLCYFLAVLVYQQLRCSAEIARARLVASLLIGLLAALFFGLLDYFKIISLLGLRQLDPVVNVGGLQFRMQSFFAHSGWFAEFLTFNIPFVLALLFILPMRRLAIASIIGLLVIGEVCLILTYQRGGWLAYPISLLVVWVSVYCFESGSSIAERSLLRKKIFKVLLSIPLTIFLSLLVVLIIFKSGLLSSDYQPSLEQYTQRFKDISKTSDRTQFFQAAFELAKINPVFGNGAESFAWMYEREYSHPRGMYHQEIILPLHGSAHNVYYQILAGQGFFGLAMLLLTTFIAIFYGFRGAFGTQSNYTNRLIALASACALTSFLIYGNVQEFFYVQALQINFFLVLTLLAIVVPENAEKAKEFMTVAVRIFIFAILAQIIWLVLRQQKIITSDSQVQATYGCTAVRQKQSVKIRDCGHRAHVLVPSDREFKIENILQPAQDLKLKFYCQKQQLAEHLIKSGASLSIAANSLSSFTECLQANKLWLTIEGDRFFLKKLKKTASGLKYRRQPLAFRILEELG